MIAKKREVAAVGGFFRGVNVKRSNDQQIRPVNLTASHCTVT